MYFRVLILEPHRILRLTKAQKSTIQKFGGLNITGIWRLGISTSNKFPITEKQKNIAREHQIILTV